MKNTIDKIDDAVKKLRTYVNSEMIPEGANYAVGSNSNLLLITRALISIVLGIKMNNEILEAKVRKVFEGVTKDDLIREIIKHPLKVTVSKEVITFDSLNKRFLNELKDNYISPDDAIEYLKRDEPQLLILTVAFAINRYEKEIDLEKLEIFDNKKIKIYMNYPEETANENTRTSSPRKKLEFRIPV